MTPGLRSILLGVACLAAACGGSSTPAPAAGSGATPGGVGASPARAVMGEPLTTRIVEDKQQGMPVGVVAVPASWTFDSNTVWNYGHYSNPVVVSLRALNPANEDGVFGFEAAQFFDLKPRNPYVRFGQNQGGMVYAPPQSPVDALARFAQQHRGKEPGFAFVGSKDLPGLPAALKIPNADGLKGVGVKVTYTLNGKPVEEEFYAVYYNLTIPYDGPQGRTYQINWGLYAPHSFRAAAGTLEARRPVFAAIVKSVRYNPEWQERLKAVTAYLAAEFNRQLQAGYDQIAAAAQMSRAISANNDAMIQTLRSQRAPATPESQAASSKFSDYIRGVETVSDPYYGTSQQSADKQFHWTDGYGTYRSSNDATFDPNRTEVGNWTLMKAVR